MSDLSRRVLARFLAQTRSAAEETYDYYDAIPSEAFGFEKGFVFRLMLGDAAPGQRKNDNKLTQPINKPKGIDRGIVKDNARTEDEHIEETATPDRKDVRPKDVFSPSPRNMNVLNFAETGKDQDQVLRDSVPKDKGWDTVKNLSQYLIRTEGGGGTPPAGK